MSEVINNKVSDAEGKLLCENQTDLKNENDSRLIEEELKPVLTYAEAPADAERKKVSIKGIIDNIVHNHKFAKVQDIVLFSLKLLPAFLCLLQMIIWAVAIKENYKSYWEAIITLDYINISMLILALIFIIALLVAVARDIIRVIKKQNEILFETISTYVAFYLLRMFAEDLFDGKKLLLSDWPFSAVLTILTIFILLYSIIRLFSEDIGSRWYGALFSGVAIILVSIMSAGGVGDFVAFTSENLRQTNVSDLNIVNYVQAIVGAEQVGTSEEILFGASKYITINALGMSFDDNVLIVLLQTVLIITAKILPFASLSMLGYLMFGLMSKNYIQFMKLNYCKKAAWSMLIASAISVIATIAIAVLFKTQDIEITVTINYVNIVMTIITIALLIILVSMPWKIYNIIYERRYSIYKRSEWGKL